MYTGFIGFGIKLSAGLFVDTFRFDARREISCVELPVTAHEGPRCMAITWLC
jgi:hypothetical protein